MQRPGDGGHPSPRQTHLGAVSRHGGLGTEPGAVRQPRGGQPTRGAEQGRGREAATKREGGQEDGEGKLQGGCGAPGWGEEDKRREKEVS